MRKLLVLCGTILCLTMTAAAQDATAAFDASSPAAEPGAPPITFEPSDRAPWQLAFGYQYQHFKALGQTFSDNGYNIGSTRYFTNSLGLEGIAAFGFGRTSAPLNIVAKSFFIGGGPHVTWHRAGRFEPWGHVLVGLEHFRFAQYSSTVGSNSSVGLMAGGGVDFRLFPRAYWRVQGDAIVSHFGSATQANYSFGTGMVLNF
jgi:hypothetical protein